LSDKDQASGYVGTDANNEMLSGYYIEQLSVVAAQTLVAGSDLVSLKAYILDDADGGGRIIKVLAAAGVTNQFYQYAIDATTGEIGTYDITTDVFLTVSGIPNLQQVTTAGFTTTTKIASSDGAGSETILNNGTIDITTGDETVTIEASLATYSYNAQLPDKLTSPQTFAMLSDISSLVTSVSAGTNISVTGTSTAPIINSLSDRYSTSSITSNTISNGAKTFTVDADLAYIPLQEVLIVHNPSNHMHATVTSYSGTTLVVDVKTNTGSGTYTSWVLNLDGVPVDAITGVGTANEIAYFTGGQVIASLDTATYPSLTELALIKGVSGSAIQTQINALNVENLSLQDGGSSIAATTYTLELYAQYAYTINQLKIISASGTCTVAVKINGVDVTGISAVSVSSTIATANASAANTVAVGDKITLVTTSNSALTNLQASLKTTRI
jgi:hypothetical protein